MSSDTSHLEQIILDFQKSMDARFDTIDTRLSSMDARFDSMDARFDSMDARFDRLEDQLGDFRDEFHAESRATRTLLNQAFEHISDQLVHDG